MSYPVSGPPPGPPPDAALPPDPTLPPGPPPFWPYTPPAPIPPARPRWHRARRACVVAAVLGVLLAAASAVVAVQSFRDARTPQAAALAYFDALARGDAASALAAGTVPGGGRALVSADVLKATLALAPITDLTTRAVSRNGDGATVQVRYRLGGTTPQEVDDAVDLHRVGGRWRLVRSAVPVSIGVDDAASWAAVPASKPFTVPSDTQLVFPGAVPVEFRTPLLEIAPTTRVVRMAAVGNSLNVGAEVSDEGRTAMTKAVVAALTACVKGGADVDPFCPQPPAGKAAGVTLRQVPQSFHGQLQGLDRLQLDVTVGPDSAGVFEVSGNADAMGEWQILDYDNVAQDKSGATSLTFGGTVPVSAPTVVSWERA